MSSRSQQKREAALRGEDMPIEFPAKTPGQVAYEAHRKLAPTSMRWSLAWEKDAWEAAAQAVREPLLHAIEETVSVYECLTAGNPFLPICYGKPVRDLWYQALGREPLPEIVPADFDPTCGVMEIAKLRASLERMQLELLRAVGGNNSLDLRPSMKSAAEFSKCLALDWPHKEAVADCSHCQLLYLAKSLYQLIGAIDAALQQAREALKVEVGS